jgi:hypothetical protein
MEARLRPMAHLRHVPMFHRVPMDVIDMPVEVHLITDEMFPESMLPEGALVSVFCGAHLSIQVD